jgi:hypothetical protein
MRPALETLGLRFAPLDEALLFSFEHLFPGLYRDVDIMRIFGTHSRFRRLIAHNEVAITATEEEFRQLPHEDRVIHLLRHYGYELRHTPAPPPPTQ